MYKIWRKVTGHYLIYISVLFFILLIILTVTLLKPAELLTAHQIYNNCKTQAIREPCYMLEFRKLTQNKNLNYITNVLSLLQTIDPQAEKCHYIAHSIARAEVLQNVNGWKEILKTVDVTTCAEGFLHGVIEAKIGSKNITTSPKEISDLCTQVDKGSRLEYGCSHIMGHFILVDSYPSIPNALKTCDEISKSNTQTFKEECYAGVFMEYSDRGNLEAHHITTLPNKTVEFANSYKQTCLSYEGLQGRACWKILGRLYAPVLNANPQDIFKACNQAPNEEYKWYCYLRAAAMMPQTPGFKQENFKDICTQFNDAEKFSICNQFVIDGLLGVSVTYKPMLLSYCKELTSKDQETCYNTIQNYTADSIKKWQ